MNSRTLASTAFLLLALPGPASAIDPAGAAGDRRGQVLIVALPTPVVECKCNASLAFSPTDGQVLCPGTSNTGCQVVWEDSVPTKGDCGVVTTEQGPQCTAITHSKCTADVPELNLSLMSCWASGVWMTASGLQGGQRFWHEDDDGISFDPDLEAECKAEGGPGTGTYTIAFYAAQTGGNPLATFTITLTCANCTVQ